MLSVEAKAIAAALACAPAGRPSATASDASPEPPKRSLSSRPARSAFLTAPRLSARARSSSVAKSASPKTRCQAGPMPTRAMQYLRPWALGEIAWRAPFSDNRRRTSPPPNSFQVECLSQSRDCFRFLNSAVGVKHKTVSGASYTPRLRGHSSYSGETICSGKPEFGRRIIPSLRNCPSVRSA